MYINVIILDKSIKIMAADALAPCHSNPCIGYFSNSGFVLQEELFQNTCVISVRIFVFKKANLFQLFLNHIPYHKDGMKWETSQQSCINRYHQQCHRYEEMSKEFEVHIDFIWEIFLFDVIWMWPHET